MLALNEQPRSILRSNTQSTNTTKRVTWADQLFSPVRRRAPPSIVPPSGVLTRVAGFSVRQRARSRERRERHACRKRDAEREARRRRRAEGVVKKRTRSDVRRERKKKRKSVSSVVSKKKKKCKRGLTYARSYVMSKCRIEGDVLDVVDAKTVYKMYADVRRRLGKKVDQGLRKRMVQDEAHVEQDRKSVRRKRRGLQDFVNKFLPGVRAEAFNRSQLSRAAYAAVLARFDVVQQDRIKM